MSAYDRVISIGPLIMERFWAGEAVTLEVPLEEPKSIGLGLNVFDGGVVWEDEHATISFHLETTEEVRRATVSVNGHNELRTSRFDGMAVPYGDGVTWNYEFEVDDQNESAQYQLPFSLTCGFARIAVRIVFKDGREATYYSHDIVCLDEPKPGGNGQSGEKAEESNVRDMYRTLLSAEDNQASEWMFATPRHDGLPLSADDDTDWSHAALARTLRIASKTLDLIYDGLDDEEDEFPNETSSSSAASRFDTQENREVRALLTSLADTMHEVERGLRVSVQMLDSMLRRLRTIVANEGAERQRPQSLPAIALVEMELSQQNEWLFDAIDMAERSDAAVVDFDEFVGGPHAVSSIPFSLPSGEGLYRSDERYEQLYRAMEQWDAARRVDVQCQKIQIHSVKPDRLYEYYALHQLLTSLFEMRFRENEETVRPIDRFEYRIADEVPQFRNEWRCANTYHLRRERGGGDVQEVDLYYQPVIYASGPLENGIRLRRIGKGAVHTSFWTPDYLLVIRDGSSERIFAIDAKYCSWQSLMGKHGRLAECVDKYLVRMARVGEKGRQRPIDGVWILSGRLDGGRAFTRKAKELLSDREDSKLTDEVCGIAYLNRTTGRKKRKAFFRQLGLN